MKLLQYLFVLLIVNSCTPRVITKSVTTYPQREAYEGFIIFTETDTVDISKEEVVGDIQIKDGGLAFDCTFERVLNLAKLKALTLGANALKVYDHRTPDLLSTCDRIKTKALRMKDIKPFEREIIWDKRRRLTIADFKGSTEDRPFRAATFSIFRYNTWGKIIDGFATLTVESYFECGRSYFKIDKDSAFVLQHEQLHFDITELYARKLTKRIKEEVKSTKELNTVGDKIVNQILDELQARQDKYDSEVYPDKNKQVIWLEKIKVELEELADYENKQIKIKFRI
jgi:hypothetical protein